MASIRKRGGSYLLVVSMGYTPDGRRRNPQQKTAYEITLRDWSSDVCSSDLQMQLKQEAAKRMSNSLFAAPNPELLVS